MFVFFCAYVSGLVERYPELFDGDAGSSTQHQINFSHKWKNYAALVLLAGGDIRNIDEITIQPLEKCLLFLAYQSDYNQLQNLVHKEMIAKSK